MAISNTSSSSLTLSDHASSVWTSSFSHNGSHIATCSSDETVRIWSLVPEGEHARGHQVACLNLHAGVVRGCDFSPDSTLLATCSWDKSAHIHSCSDYMLLNKFLGHQYGLSAVRFSPSGRVLATCSWDDSIRLWDIQTGTLLGSLEGHTSPVAACVFLENGNVLASCSWDGTVRLWDLTSSSERRAAITLKGHPDAVYDVSATPSDANLLISCGRKGALVLWDLRGPVPWQSLECNNWSEINCVSLAPSGSHFVTGDNMGELRLWDIAAVKASTLRDSQPRVLHAHASTITATSFCPDGSYFASSSTDETCRVWDSTHTLDTSVASLTDSLANQLAIS